MRKIFVSIFLLSLGFSLFAAEANAQAETQFFFIDSSYDLFGRKEIDATFVRSDNRLYFYVETSWWDSRIAQEQNDLRIALAELGLEFQNRIYPTVTSTFGSEPKPGIDRDDRITVLVHQMGGDAGGYFRTSDVYERIISPMSNEREMVYLNSRHISTSQAKSFLAHEFTHLIVTNQKDLLRRISDETWLNEARAEYAPTLLGYDDPYKGSNLERRVRDFLSKPSASLTEWGNTSADYGVINLFAQYLVDHYGVRILTDSLQSSMVGIASINNALLKSGFQKDSAQIFTEWTIALLMNDCGLGEYYCYRNPHLQDLRITPIPYFIPRSEAIFSTYHTTLPWSANWHRLVGGAQNFTLEFDGADSVELTVPYVLCKMNNSCSTGILALDANQKGKLVFSEFEANYSSLTIIPFVANMNGAEEQLDFSWQVRVEREQSLNAEDPEFIRKLLVRIAELQEQVRRLQAQIVLLHGQNRNVGISCMHFETNLSFGMRNEQVRCLQEFLAAQGAAVYPEGLVTGNFLSATRQAVIRFQETYASEILAPAGLQKGTGYVGQMTRNKMNQLLGSLVVL